ncbi:eukaryotic translation initiation factor 3 delta subunit, putative [Eimeria necatrix]|uniref:Serine-threonine kinase receptor-associated protein n=1 Tax=Eimeria necatrix TaxID=51315 RepID=U6MH60_9EIME|nr:eukaryotic translation initiation factor 3 delta subunit, putative [Eimeria necatrix]CDJ62408.1 eukaryotic translation initiation factor 3 delta subunit, putative [Eimeria necatrix]
MYPLLLQGHDRPLTWVQFNRDGDLMFTCGKDAKLSLWRTEDGIRIGTYDVGKAVVWACDCTLDSSRLVAASGDQKILIFDVCSGALLNEIAEQGPCKFVEWCRMPTQQNKFVLAHDNFGANQKGIKAWRVDGETPKRLWIQDDFAARCIQVHWGPFDETVISTHENGDIMVWDAATGEYISELRGHKSLITCMSFSDDRMLALTSCSDGTAKLWSTKDWECLKASCRCVAAAAAAAAAVGIAAAPLGFRLRLVYRRELRQLEWFGELGFEFMASGEGKFEALLYHVVRGEEIASCKGHFGPLHTLAWKPDGSGYASGGEDGYVRLYSFDEEYFTDDKFQ